MSAFDSTPLSSFVRQAELLLSSGEVGAARRLLVSARSVVPTSAGAYRAMEAAVSLAEGDLRGAEVVARDVLRGEYSETALSVVLHCMATEHRYGEVLPFVAEQCERRGALPPSRRPLLPPPSLRRLYPEGWLQEWALAQLAASVGDVDLAATYARRVAHSKPDFWFAREFDKHLRGYYSQMGQDEFIEQFFRERPPEDTYCIEVGGFDGVHYSNIRRLVERYGWRGLTFEPVPVNAERCRESYFGLPVEVVEAAASDAAGELDLHISRYPHLPQWGSDVATFDADERARWEQYGAAWHMRTVPVVRLDDELGRRGIHSVGLLSIDAEGYDLQVLRGVGLREIRPELIVVEYGKHRAAIIDYLSSAGYSLLHDNGQDLFAAPLSTSRRYVSQSGGAYPPARNFSNPEPYRRVQEYVEGHLADIVGVRAHDVQTIVIVGGYTGEELPRLRRHYPGAKMVVFEPNPSHLVVLRRVAAEVGNVVVLPFAVSDNPGRVEFHETNVGGAGSLLPLSSDDESELSRRAYGINQAGSFSVEAVRLDDVKELQGRQIDLLWIDVQGAEDKVLRGSLNILDSVRAVFAEVWAYSRLYSSQARLSDLEDILSPMGFYLSAIGLDTEVCNGSGNALWQREEKSAGEDRGVRSGINSHLFESGYITESVVGVRAEIAAGELFHPLRFDIGAKTLYARHQSLGVSSDWHREVYFESLRAMNGFQEGDGSGKSSFEDFVDSYDRLIASFLLSGAESTLSVIPVAQDRLIVDGAHRVAAGCVFGLDLPVVAIQRPTNQYGAPWFTDRGLGRAYADAMAIEFVRYAVGAVMVVLFPAGQGKDAEVLEILSRYGTIAYAKAVDINPGGGKLLVQQIYAGEPWLGTVADGFAGAAYKASQCYSRPGWTRVIAWRCGDAASARQAKEEIRALYGVGNHSVHMSDTPEEALVIARAAYNSNSVDFLNTARPQWWPRFWGLLDRYRRTIDESGADADCFVVDGSSIMAVHGIREARDIDFLHFGYDDLDFGNPDEIGSHNTLVGDHVVGRDAILFDPANHFWFGGIKFGTLSVVRSMKAKRGEGKDAVDVQSIDTFLGHIPAPPRGYHETRTADLSAESIAVRSGDTVKIVALIPARNESAIIEQCLRAVSIAVDAVVYLDDCSTDGSLDIVRSLAAECKVERILTKQSWYRDEPGDRNRLLEAGRQIGGTHFLVIDADEMLTANLVLGGGFRAVMEQLQPGDTLALWWIQLWRTAVEYRHDSSIWTNIYKPVAFCDRPGAAYSSEFIHTPRIPGGLGGKQRALQGNQAGLLHFQFVYWDNLVLKQSWYKMLERVREPRKSTAEINDRYRASTDETGLATKPILGEWFAGYDFFLLDGYYRPDTWRLAQIAEWFGQYGAEYFRDLEIWEHEGIRSLAQAAEDARARAPQKSNLTHWRRIQDGGYFENHSQRGTWRYDAERAEYTVVSHKDRAYIEAFGELTSDDVVVVIGCGFGREILQIAPHVQHVYGIDVEPGILEKARKFLHEHGIENITLIQATDWEAKIPTGITLVYSITVFQHLTKDLTCSYIRGLGGKLAAAGRFVVQFADLDGGTDDAELRTYEPNVRWSAEQINTVAAESGLRCEGIVSMPIAGAGWWHWAHLTKNTSAVGSVLTAFPPSTDWDEIASAIQQQGVGVALRSNVWGMQSNMSRADLRELYRSAYSLPGGAHILILGSSSGIAECVVGWSRIEARASAVVTGVGLWPESGVEAASAESYEGYLRTLLRFGVIATTIPMRMTSQAAAGYFANEDVDLLVMTDTQDYASCLRDLRRYWPTLRLGGNILCHQYTHREDVRKAVADFVGDKGIAVSVPDGTSFCRLIKEHKGTVQRDGGKQLSSPDAVAPIDGSGSILLSALVSTYNSEQFIAGCLEDLVGQSLFRKGLMEIVVVDSASEQREKDVVDEYISRYGSTLIRYMRTPRRETLYGAWNTAIAAARGRYLTSANTDDRHHPEALEILVQALEGDESADLVYADCGVTEIPNQHFSEWDGRRIFRYHRYFAPSVLLAYQFGPQPVWRASIHRQVGLFNERYKAAGDYEWNIRFAMAGKKAVHLPRVLGLFLQNKSSLSNADATSVGERDEILNEYRNPHGILSLYALSGVDVVSAEQRAAALVDMGLRACMYRPPWCEGAVERDLPFAYQCFEAAFSLHRSVAAGVNLAVLGMMLFPDRRQSFVELMRNIPEANIFFLRATSDLLRGRAAFGEYALLWDFLPGISPQQELECDHVSPGSLGRVLPVVVGEVDDREHEYTPESVHGLRVTFLVPGLALSGGIKTVVELAAAFADEGAVVTIVAIGDGDPSWICLPKGVDVIRSADNDEALLRTVPDADIIFATLYTTAYFVWRLPHSKGRKMYLIQGYEAVGIGDAPQSVFTTYALPLRKLCVSGYLRDVLSILHGVESVVVGNGLSDDYLEQIPAKASGGRLRVGALYHPQYGKAGDLLLHAIVFLRHRYGDVDFVGVGTVDYDPSLGMFDEYHRALPPERMHDYYRSLDIFLAPSWQEGFGLTALEAMAHGVAVVTADNGGSAEYAHHGRTALVVPSRSWYHLARAAESLIIDAELRGKLASNARVEARRHTIRGMYSRVVTECKKSLYTEIEDPAGWPRVGFIAKERYDAACPRVRLGAPLEVADAAGILCYSPVASFTDALSVNYAELARVHCLILQRQAATAAPTAVFRHLLGHRPVRIIYEIDDALLDLEADHPHYGHFKQLSPALAEYITNADAITVSTEALKQLIEARTTRPVFVLPNCIDMRLWRAIDRRNTTHSETVRILFSGTLSHASDFTLIRSVMRRILDIYRDRVELVVWGGTDDKEMLSWPGVVQGPDFTASYEEYAHVLMSLNIDLAVVPLRDTILNRCKSHIKWLEYSIAGIPGVWSNVGEYATSIEHGVTGLLAGTETAWFDAIVSMVEDRNLRIGIARAAQEQVLQRWTLQGNIRRWGNLYTQLSSPFTAPVPEPVAVDISQSVILASIVIPIWNNLELTKCCIDKIASFTPAGIYEIIAVDNGSSDGVETYLAGLAEQGVIRLVRNEENLGFARACNQGIEASTGKYVVLLNNDTEVQPGWLTALLDIMEADAEIGVAGSLLLYPGDEQVIQHAGVTIGYVNGKMKVYHPARLETLEDAPEMLRSRYCSAVTGACMMLRRTAIDEVGPFDEAFVNGYEDVDLCLRMRRSGYKVFYCADSVVVHHESKTPGRKDRDTAGAELLERRWSKVALGDVDPAVAQAELIEGVFHGLWLADKNVEDKGLYSQARRFLGRGVYGTNYGTIKRRDIRSRAREVEDSPHVHKVAAISIVVLMYNQWELTRQCLESLAEATSQPFECIVVDNCSEAGQGDLAAQWCKGKSEFEYLRLDDPYSFSAANNFGASCCSAPILVFLNNDTKILPGSFDAIFDEFDSYPSTGIVGGRLLYENGKIQHAGVAFGARPGRPKEPFHIFLTFDKDDPAVASRNEYQFVTGACMAVRAEAFYLAGGFDEEYHFGWEDTDLCMHIRQLGYGVVYRPDLLAYHYESVTKRLREQEGTYSFAETSAEEQGNRERFFSKWGSLVVDDMEERFAAAGFEIDGNVLRRKSSVAVETDIPRTSFDPAYRTKEERSGIVVFLLTPALGDVVMMTSVLAAFAARHPEASIVVSVSEPFRWIFQRLPYVADTVAAGSAEERRVVQLAAEIINYRGVIAGFPEYYNGISLLDILANIAGVKLQSSEVAIYVEEPAEDAALIHMAPYMFRMRILVHLYSNKDGDLSRSYPHYAELVSALLDTYPDAAIVHVGLDDVLEPHARVLDMAKSTIPLEEQLAVIRLCTHAIVVDSGFLHVAQRWAQIPTLLIAGIINPWLSADCEKPISVVRAEGHPLLDSYWRRRGGSDTMSAISPASVLSAFSTLIQQERDGALSILPPLPLKHITVPRGVQPHAVLFEYFSAALRQYASAIRIVLDIEDQSVPPWIESFNGVDVRRPFHQPRAQELNPMAEYPNYGERTLQSRHFPDTLIFSLGAKAEDASTVNLMEGGFHDTRAREYLQGVADNSVQALFLDRVPEFIGDEEFALLLGECVRVLRPGGQILISVTAYHVVVRELSESWNTAAASEKLFRYNAPVPRRTVFDDMSLQAALFGAGLQLATSEITRDAEDMPVLTTVVVKPSAARRHSDQATALGSALRATGSAAVRVPRIVWEGSQFVWHSLALINRELCRRLDDTGGVHLSLIPYEQDRFDPRQRPEWQRLASLYTHAEAVTECDTWVTHRWPPRSSRPEKAKRWVVNQPWEFWTLPVEFVEVFRHADQIWTPSTFSRECFVRSGLDPEKVQVVPNGIDPELMTPFGTQLRLPTEKSWKFLFVGGTIWRKGFDILLEAYLSAFTADDDVVLVVKDMGGDSFYSGQTAKQKIEQIRATPGTPEIVYLDGYLSEEQIAALYRACDVFVSPYRGEGFSLPTLEAMACGLPVIVTGGGSTDDFVDSSVGIQVAAELVSIGHSIDKRPLTGEAFVRNPVPSEVAAAMRRLFESPATSRALGVAAQLRARTGWTWDRAAMKAMALLDGLQGTGLALQAEARMHPVDDGPTNFALAEVAISAGDVDRAIALYTKALEQKKLPEIYALTTLNRLAAESLSNGDLQLALDFLQKASDIREGYADTDYVAALLFQHNGQWEESVILLQRILDGWKAAERERFMNYSLSDVLVHTGRALMELGDLEDASSVYGLAVAQDGNNASAWLGLALLAHRTGRRAEAKAAIERAVAIDARYEEFRTALFAEDPY